MREVRVRIEPEVNILMRMLHNVLAQSCQQLTFDVSFRVYLAGGYLLKQYLGQRVLTVNDIDLFIGYTWRENRPITGRDKERIRKLVLRAIELFGTSLPSNTYNPSIRVNGDIITPNTNPYSNIEGILMCARSRSIERLPGREINYILRDDLSSSNSNLFQKMNSLVSGFDMDILQIATTVTPVGSLVSAATPEFLAAKDERLVTTVREVSEDRKIKYQDRLRPLGYNFSWELS